MIKNFNGDIDELRSLILNSWHVKFEKKIIYDYTVPFLNWNLNGPNKDPHMQLGYYRNEKLVGFMASLPRLMSFRGNIGKYNITTYFSVDQNYKGFIGYKLIKEQNRRFPLSGYEASIYYIEKQQKQLSEELIKSNFKRDNISYDMIGQTYFLMKIFDYDRINIFSRIPYFHRRKLEFKDNQIYKPSCMGTIRYYNPSKDIKHCLTLLNSYTSTLDFARLWKDDELAWQLYYPGISNTLLYEVDNEIKGLINYYIVDVVREKNRDKLVKIDNIYFRELDFKQKKKFLIEALNIIKRDEDVMGVTLFFMPYFYNNNYFVSSFLTEETFDDKLFDSLNFFPDNDYIRIYTIIFNNEIYKNVFPFYLDYR